MLFACLFMFSYSFGQNRVQYGVDKEIDLTTLSNADYVKNQLTILNGTFQLQISKSGFAPLYSREMIELVVNSRELTMDKHVVYSNEITLFIPSEQSIADFNYVPLPLVKYVTSFNTADDEK